MAQISPNQVRDILNTEAWKKQVWYWRTHLDIFIEAYLHVKLKDTQRVEARAFGNCETLYFIQSRGYGKTWITAICCIAMAILYPGSPIAVVSGTAEQAVLVIKKIDDFFSRNEDIMREFEIGNHRPVVVSRSKGIVRFKNGSKIESYSLGTFRGARAKIIVIDEAPEVKKDDLTAVVKPVRNCTRDNAIQYGFKDYASKMVSITSACLKSNYFYDAFVDTLKRMGKGDLTSFAFALDYKSAARVGITPLEFFEKERETMPDSKFQMEYGSIFLGAESGSLWPYELTDRCRTLVEVEVAQPAKSTSQYVMSLDIATSSAKHADNAVLTVFKLVEREDGSYRKKVVKIRSFHGKRLDSLAVELRKELVRFPNTIKVIYDGNGLGNAFPEFLSQPWTDPDTNKEYPPLVNDNEHSIIRDAVPLLRLCQANNQVNQRLAALTTINFEREMIELPVNSRHILGNNVILPSDDDDLDEDENPKKKRRTLTMEEKAIYIEADACQIELGCVVSKESASGAVVYDTAKSTQHKDRWSSLAMGLLYISELEDERKAKIFRNTSTSCVGVVIKF